jgi:hypothetical protein
MPEIIDLDEVLLSSRVVPWFVKLPGKLYSRTMRKHFFALTLAWLAIAPAVAGDAPTVLFDKKYFTDRGNIVNVEGLPMGEGASPDTTRWAL